MNKNKNILNWPAGCLDFSNGALIMGILNVTPDSFSDSGKYLDTDAAVQQGVEMAQAGAAIIDVGPESTRPGSEPVPADQQIKRAIPAIKALVKKTDIPISIDTSNYEVAATAIQAGASIINDITALTDDRITSLASENQLPVILMHMRGTPATMQKNPKYDDVVTEVLQFLIERAERAESLGVDREKIFIDPGIGFGKTFEHNILLLKNIDKFVDSGYRVLLGTSRKGFLGKITGKENPADRIFATAATVALAAAAGVSIIRVHDVGQMLDVVKVTNAIKQ